MSDTTGTAKFAPLDMCDPRNEPWRGAGPPPNWWMYCSGCEREVWPTYTDMLHHELYELREIRDRATRPQTLADDLVRIARDLLTEALR